MILVWTSVICMIGEAISFVTWFDEERESTAFVGLNRFHLNLYPQITMEQSVIMIYSLGLGERGWRTDVLKAMVSCLQSYPSDRRSPDVSGGQTPHRAAKATLRWSSCCWIEQQFNHLRESGQIRLGLLGPKDCAMGLVDGDQVSSLHHGTASKKPPQNCDHPQVL